MAYDIIHISGKPHFLIPVHEFTAMQANGKNDLPQSILEQLAVGNESAIKVLRKHRKMTQADLAEAAGISRPYLTEIETGKKEGSIRALKSIAAALNVSLEILA